MTVAPDGAGVCGAGGACVDCARAGADGSTNPRLVTIDKRTRGLFIIKSVSLNQGSSIPERPTQNLHLVVITGCAASRRATPVPLRPLDGPTFSAALSSAQEPRLYRGEDRPDERKQILTGAGEKSVTSKPDDSR